MISWEDFEKVELRAGTIVDAQAFPELVTASAATSSPTTPVGKRSWLCAMRCCLERPRASLSMCPGPPSPTPRWLTWGLPRSRPGIASADAVMTCEWPMERVDRAQAEGNTDGFVKLVHKKDGSFLGATIVAERAGEMIHEWIVALEHSLKVGDLAGMFHVYPTYSTASMQAAAAIRVEQWLSSTSGQVIRRLARLMR